jgi:hypothetical protein
MKSFGLWLVAHLQFEFTLEKTLPKYQKIVGPELDKILPNSSKVAAPAPAKT